MISMEAKKHIQAQLAAHPLFETLPSTVHTELVARAALFFLEPGEILYASGTSANRVFVVVEGALQIEYPDPGATRGRVAAILTAPCFLGEAQVMHQKRWSGTGVAVTNLVAIGVTREQLEALILEHPSFALELYREITQRFLRAIESWKASPSRRPEEALARYLVGYLRVVEATTTLALNQADLGRATGLCRETVNRLLKRWSRTGVLAVNPKGLTKIRRAKLRKLMGAQDSEDLTQGLEARLSPEMRLG